MSSYVCQKCGYHSISWYGKCPECGVFNSLKEKVEEKKTSRSRVQPAVFTKLSNITALSTTRKETVIKNLNNVLGGGLVAGEAVLIAGEPGVGKSTLLLTALSGLKVLYVSGEESGSQIRDRADRMKVDITNLFFSDDSSLEAILAALEDAKDRYDVLVIDSIQTLHSASMTSQKGNVSQVRHIVSELVDVGKQRNLPVVMVGHITKGGDIAGPKTLEHLVDCVLYLEGEKFSHFRILRCIKNRFGPTDEVGVFAMGADGLRELNDPGAFLQKDPNPHAVGKVVVGVVEGSRVLFYEVQSLVVPTALSVPRRVVSGVDYNKVQLLLAVIRKYLRISLDTFDVFVNVTGGVSIKSTAADLGIVASILSSMKSLPISARTVFSGEVGLLGEVRDVYGVERIIREAKRFGFKDTVMGSNLPSIIDLPKKIGVR